MKQIIAAMHAAQDRIRNELKIKGEHMAIDISKLEDEIIMLINTKKKLVANGGSNAVVIKEYLDRINVLFLEGQISTDAYKMISALYTGKLPSVLEPKIVYRAATVSC